MERKILNVDPHRPRCHLADLNQAKLRRVSFCVDVEIAPMPKYVDAETAAAAKKAGDKTSTQRRKLAEKGEGDVLRRPKPIEEEKGVETATETENGVSEKQGEDGKGNAVAKETPEAGAGRPAGDLTRKKEKKKKSEEERKARKERKRRLAEANGTIPIEIYIDSDDSDKESSNAPPASPKTPRIQLTPTTNPVRIYRRCCQLRETPILKRVTEQLSDPALFCADEGIVRKLDLTGYWLQLADLITLGDFLAVVTIREVVLENCGLNDEGIRVILAGLLAARKPAKKQIHLHHYHHHFSNCGPPHKAQTVPVTASLPNGDAHQGGFVERLVLKNNKIGVEGWKYVCLFIYMCRSLKALDLSNVVFPHVPVSKPPTGAPQPQPQPQPFEITESAPSPPNRSTPQRKQPFDIFQLLSRAIGERLGGATLELLNFGDTGLSADQLGWIVEGIIGSGTKRLGLAHNDLDSAGVEHVARYIASGKCEGLDLGGNDLRDHLGVLAEAIATNNSLWALSLADCNLAPSLLCKLLPKLVHLPNFRFIDLSHNHELFEARPSAIGTLRRYLPLMESLKRLHLADVAMSSEQAIALAEVLPEVKELAHLNILQNPELTKLADARTEEAQEQACAFYASFLAATRLSTSIVAIDMPVPTAESTEIVRAMAKQVLAYCLRNVDRVTLGNPAAPILGGDARAIPPTNITTETANDGTVATHSFDKDELDYPDVIQHLVGHDASTLRDDDDISVAPDDNYVIGGTGVAQALECCLKNRRPEGDAVDGSELAAGDGSDGLVEAASTGLPSAGKAKDMSKHLLQSARKIRLRLQPALQRARMLSDVDNQAYREFSAPLSFLFLLCYFFIIH